MDVSPQVDLDRLTFDEYLTDVLARLPSIKITEIHELLPAHSKPQPAATS
jgi:hypothetical protein